MTQRELIKLSVTKWQANDTVSRRPGGLSEKNNTEQPRPSWRDDLVGLSGQKLAFKPWGNWSHPILDPEAGRDWSYWKDHPDTAGLRYFAGKYEQDPSFGNFLNMGFYATTAPLVTGISEVISELVSPIARFKEWAKDHGATETDIEAFNVGLLPLSGPESIALGVASRSAGLAAGTGAEKALQTAAKLGFEPQRGTALFYSGLERGLKAWCQ